MISSRRVFIPLGLAAAAATIGACTTGPAVAESTEPPIGAVPVVISGADIVLPLDAYLLTGKQQITLDVAVTKIAQGCMKRLGLSWPVNPPPAGDDAPRNDRRYSVIEPAKAKTIGYHAPETAPSHVDRKVPTADAMNVWAGRGEQTFHGKPVPAGGCAGDAARQLAQGAPTVDPGLPERLQFASYTQTKADSRIVRVFAEWSKCMRAKGHAYPDPYTAAGDQRWQTPKAGPAEIAVATADVACKSETHLPGWMLAVETAYQNKAIAQNKAKLTAITTYLQTELTNAAKQAR